MICKKSTIGAQIVLNKRVINIQVGDMLQGVHYLTDDGQNATISGRLRVINATVERNTVAVSTSCPPQPYLQDYVHVVSIVVDTSTEMNADYVCIPIENIFCIESVNGFVDYENVVDTVIEMLGGDGNPVVTELEDNSYEIKGRTDTFTSIFDEIIRIAGNVDSMYANVEHQRMIQYFDGTNLNTFKEEIDKLLPKCLEDPSAAITLTINFK